MKRAAIRISSMAGLCLWAACASAAPASQPAAALPPGHPALPAKTAKTATTGPSLPAGHPDISSLQQLPQTNVRGTLTIKAVQGTAGAAPPVGDKVIVELYNFGQLVNSAEAKLDESGTAVAENVPVAMACQPVVKVLHAGVTYQAVGEVMDAAHPNLKLEVPVYETTDQKPQWQVKMRHVIVKNIGKDGLSVLEMLMVENPSNRAWLGERGRDGKRVTLDLPVTPGARNVQLAGAQHESCAATADGRVVDAAPLVPGSTELQISYTLPFNDGKAELAIAAPAPTGHLMLFVPDDGSTISGDGLLSAGAADMGQGPTRFFSVPGMEPGKVLRVSIVGKPAADQAAAATARHTTAASAMPTIVGGACALLLLVGTAVIFLRPAKTASTKA